MKLTSSLKNITYENGHCWHQTTLDSFKSSKFGFSLIPPKKSSADQIFGKKIPKQNPNAASTTMLQQKITAEVLKKIPKMAYRIVPVALTVLFSGLVIGALVANSFNVCSTMKKASADSKSPLDASPDVQGTKELKKELLDTINNVESYT
jgi:hypothetical protein